MSGKFILVDDEVLYNLIEELASFCDDSDDGQLLSIILGQVCKVITDILENGSTIEEACDDTGSYVLLSAKLSDYVNVIIDRLHERVDNYGKIMSRILTITPDGTIAIATEDKPK